MMDKAIRAELHDLTAKCNDLADLVPSLGAHQAAEVLLTLAYVNEVLADLQDRLAWLDAGADGFTVAEGEAGVTSQGTPDRDGTAAAAGVAQACASAPSPGESTGRGRRCL